MTRASYSERALASTMPCLSSPTAFPRSQYIANRLRAFMERAKMTAADIERITATDGGPAPVSAVTVRRILKATARTEPERQTMERIAAAIGVSYFEAFPDWDPDPWAQIKRSLTLPDQK